MGECIRTLPYGVYSLDPFARTNTICLGFGDESNLGGHVKIFRRASSRDCDTRGIGAYAVGRVINTCFVLRKCPCNAHQALCSRHGCHQPAVLDDFSSVSGAFSALFRSIQLDYLHCDYVQFSNWIQKWPESKRRAILQSIDSDRVMPHRAQANVKRECDSTLPTRARLIQFYYNLATQAAFAPQFYALQKTLTDVVRYYPMGCVDVTFASGMCAADVTAWAIRTRQRGARVYYERDGKTWDATMSATHSQFRCWLYSFVDTNLSAFAGLCTTVRAVAKFRNSTMAYSVKHTVKSGHNDTTLGNSVINAAIAVKVFQDLAIPASIIVAGDDLLVAAYVEIDADSSHLVKRVWVSSHRIARSGMCLTPVLSPAYSQRPMMVSWLSFRSLGNYSLSCSGRLSPLRVLISRVTFAVCVLACGLRTRIYLSFALLSTSRTAFRSIRHGGINIKLRV